MRRIVSQRPLRGLFGCLSGLWLFLFCLPAWAQGSSNNPAQRAQVEYTSVYFDDIETPAPTVGPDFMLDVAGTITSDPAEVIDGSHSVKGAYFGTRSYTPYLRTDASPMVSEPSGSRCSSARRH